MRSRPNQPKRSIAAATSRLPLIRRPIAAATPIFGAANVSERMMNALRIPPSHSHSQRLMEGRLDAVQATPGDEQHRDAGCRGDERREADRLDRPHPVAELTEHCRLHGAGEARRERHHDSEGSSARHQATLLGSGRSRAKEA
jgi:hypothetical protein